MMGTTGFICLLLVASISVSAEPFPEEHTAIGTEGTEDNPMLGNAEAKEDDDGYTFDGPIEDLGERIDDDEDEDSERNFGKGLSKFGKKVGNCLVKGGKVLLKAGKKVLKGGKKLISKGKEFVKKNVPKVIKGAKQAAIKGGKKVVKVMKSDFVKKGRKLALKGLKTVGTYAVEEFGDVALEMTLAHFFGEKTEGLVADNEEEDVEEKVDKVEEEDNEELNLVEYINSDDHCKCLTTKKCGCCVELDGYQKACLNITIIPNLFEDESKVVMNAFYGGRNVMSAQFKANEKRKLCKRLPKNFSGKEICFSSLGKSVEDYLMAACFEFSIEEEGGITKCIFQSTSKKLVVKSVQKDEDSEE